MSSCARSMRWLWIVPLLAWIQIFVMVRDRPAEGPWFLYGRDTIYHDAVVQLWVQQWAERDPGVIPLWMPGLQNGLPTLGAFLWTPFAPQAWPLLAFDFPMAQRLGWWLSLTIAGLGGFALARAMGLRRGPAVFAGSCWMLCGHFVTLIHAGHFQKVMALAWMPLAVAGALRAVSHRDVSTRARGVAAGAFALGMTTLCGHPQVTYMSLALIAGVGLMSALRKRWRDMPWLAALMAVGMTFSAAQLLPGVEFSRVSNRAAGVSYAEAAGTSYPPGELTEFVIPRVKGSSVADDKYHGEWGERIVSDYFGLSIFIALLGVVPAVLTKWRRRAGIAWMVVVAVSLVVGVGSHTPVYRILWTYLPGFASFRSPGTFMAPASLALAMLAGTGVNWLLRCSPRLPQAGRVAVALVLCVAGLGTVMRANMFFLIAVDWRGYEAGFLAPNELDLWLAEDNRRAATHDTASELSLRPLLFGGRALNGYHPVTFAAKEYQDRATGLSTPEWYAAKGVGIVLAGHGARVEGLSVGGDFGGAGRTALILPKPSWPLEVDFKPAAWTKRTPNVWKLELPPGAQMIVVCENLTRGFRIISDGKDLPAPIGPQTSWSGAVAGPLEFRYEPFSYRLGVFLTACAAAVMAGLMALRRK